MSAAQSILSQLAEEFRESLLAFQAQAAAEPEVDLALFPDLLPEPTGSNAWLAYMEYGSDERGHWPPAAIVAADGSVRLEYGEATLEVLDSDMVFADKFKVDQVVILPWFFPNIGPSLMYDML